MTKNFDSAKQQTQTSSGEDSLMTLMGQMLRLPFTGFVYSFEIFIRTMREMQRLADQSFEGLAGDIVQSSNDTSGHGNVSGAGGTGTDLNNQTTREEESGMWDDQDLSGDDLKYVSYSILFTKRDLEATLEEQKQDLVSYSTNGGSYGGLKIAKFMGRLMDKEGKGVPRPEIWKENNYPNNNAEDTHWKFPDDDEKYITFIYKVDRRLSRQDADYDKQKLDALRGIKSSIDSVSAKIA